MKEREDQGNAAGRTCLVTGATSGLGLALCVELARRGARIIATGRDLGRGEAALSSIRRAVPDAEVELRMVDLADLNSVRALAAGIERDRLDLDLLVNNAGIMMPPRRLSAQGHESQFAVNHLAHFVLTSLLLRRLNSSSEGRVVTVSSELHRRGQIHFDDISGERRYGRVRHYAQSKLANVLFALELDRRLRAAGSRVRSIVVHPGYAATNLQTGSTTGLLRQFMRIGRRFLAQPVEAGAANLVHAATADLPGGSFVGPNGFRELRGSPVIVHPAEQARDLATARRLWKLSEGMTGADWGELSRVGSSA